MVPATPALVDCLSDLVDLLLFGALLLVSRLREPRFLAPFVRERLRGDLPEALLGFPHTALGPFDGASLRDDPFPLRFSIGAEALQMVLAREQLHHRPAAGSHSRFELFFPTPVLRAQLVVTPEDVVQPPPFLFEV